MTELFDIIVIGTGGFGSAALSHLARRGMRVLGLDRFPPAHDRGSSHGETRIIRQAYFEHPDYVPLLRRAYELWRGLELDSSQSLMRLCGLLVAGPGDGEAVSGARLAAKLHGIELENIPRDDFAVRFPGFRIPEDSAAVFEPHAGYLHVERCVQAHLALAQGHGAVLQTGETVQGWSSDGTTVRVQTDRGEYSAAGLVVTAGAWASGLLADVSGVALRVLRKPSFWFPVRSTVHNLDNGGCGYFFERPEGAFYGLPSLDGKCLKVAEHSHGEAVADPLQVDRMMNSTDIDPVASFAGAILNDVEHTPVRHSICMYTMSPDGHFIVDKHPEFANVVFGAGFSGHGFKFTSVIGEALADLAMDGHTELPIEFLSLRRFAS